MVKLAQLEACEMSWKVVRPVRRRVQWDFLDTITRSAETTSGKGVRKNPKWMVKKKCLTPKMTQ